MPMRLSNKAVKDATGREWEEWFSLLDSAGARELSHKELVRWMIDSGTLDLSWWTQMVVVEYERHIGRRAAGQQEGGEWNASCSKSFSLDIDQALALWLTAVDAIQNFNGNVLNSDPRLSSSAKWRYWRADFSDGSSVSVNIGSKGESKSTVAVDHGKIGDDSSAACWKEFWRNVLNSL